MKSFLIILISLLLNCFFVAADDSLVLFSNEAKKQTMYELAEDWVGYVGDCYVTATMFLRDYYDDDLFKISLSKATEISYDELEPGDIVYYEELPTGKTHWAAYIGEEKALQGNFGPTHSAIILPVKVLPTYTRWYYRLNYEKQDSTKFVFSFNLY